MPLPTARPLGWLKHTAEPHKEWEQGQQSLIPGQWALQGGSQTRFRMVSFPLVSHHIYLCTRSARLC